MNTEALAWALAQPAGSEARVLASAFTSGTQRVTFEGRTVEYRSTTDLAAALAALFAASDAPGARRPRVAVARVAGMFP
jgi:hypothetical protein